MKKLTLTFGSLVSIPFSIGLLIILFSFIGNKQEDNGSLIFHLKLLDNELQLSNVDRRNERVFFLTKLNNTFLQSEDKATAIKIQEDVLAGVLASEKILDYVDSLKQALVARTGGYENNNPSQLYKGARDLKLTEELMIGKENNKTGEGYKLLTQLLNYKNKLIKISSTQNTYYDLLGIAPKDDPRITEYSQKEKDYVSFHFKGAPMIMVMAELGRIEAEILRAEKYFRETLANELISNETDINNFKPIAIPTSKIVTVGTKYEASLFLGTSSNSIVPSMMCRGTNIPVDPATKTGKIAFMAMAGGPVDSNGYFNQKYYYSITIKYKGKDTTFEGQETYFVKKPTIQVSSYNLLYMNCGNELSVDVPELGNQYNPSFTAVGADVIKGAKKGIVYVAPQQGRVELKISSNGNYVGNQFFNTLPVPFPTITAQCNGKEMDEKIGMDVSTIKTIKLRAVSDVNFAMLMPKDARYRIASWSCTLVRGKRPVSILNLTEETADISAVMANAQAGDRLLIEVKEVKRTNFMNKTEIINLGSIFKNIPLN